jgi:hypothetical protein
MELAKDEVKRERERTIKIMCKLFVPLRRCLVENVCTFMLWFLFLIPRHRRRSARRNKNSQQVSDFFGTKCTHSFFLCFPFITLSLYHKKQHYSYSL